MPYKEYTLQCGPPGGELFSAVTSDPKSFNPIVAQETSTSQITSLMFEGLTRMHPLTLDVLPNLAKQWETIDGKDWIFHLRDDVFWSDGVKFSADDVVWTFNALVYNPEIPSSSRDIFTIGDKIIEVSKIDEYTVRFKLPCAFAPFLRALSQDILPEHIYKQAVIEKRFSFSMGLDAGPRDIIGSGPFCLEQYLPSERIVLKRNPFYWKRDACGAKLPYLERLVFIILSNSDTALLRFLEGEIDYYALRSQDLAVLGPRQDRDNFTIYNAGPSLGSNFLALNQSPGVNPFTHKPYVPAHKLKWFRDRRFREAIALALNREKIITVVFNGLGVEQYSALSAANTFFYAPDVQKYPYSPAKARQLLAAVGFDLGADGVWKDKGGNKLEINFFTNADSLERIQIAALIKKDLEDIGMKINFLPLDFNNLVSKLTASYDWEMVLIGLSGGGIEPYFGKNVWSYKGNLHMWNPTGKPIDEYEEEIEDIFNSSAATLDSQARKEMFARWQQIVARELPLIYTVIPDSLYAVREKFGNLYPTVYGGAFSEIEHIYKKD